VNKIKYRAATTNSEKPDSRNFRVRNSHGQHGNLPFGVWGEAQATEVFLFRDANAF